MNDVLNRYSGEVFGRNLHIPRFEEIPPHLWNPTLNDIRYEWVRRFAVTHKLDQDTLVLGDVLDTIIGDDANYFAWDMQMAAYKPQLALWTREGLCIILFNEHMETQFAIPDDIRSQIAITYSRVRTLDWTQREQYVKAKRHWFAMKKWIETQVGERKDLKDALDYRRQYNELFSQE